MVHKTSSIFAVLLFAVATVKGETATACYGTDPTCDYYSMQCGTGRIIKLYNLYAGYKNTSNYPICGTANHCADEAICCSLGSGPIDLLNEENTYKTYTNCSGKESCVDVHAPWQLIASSSASLLSSYVHLEYECEDATRKVPFCGGPTGSFSNVYNDVEIMFDGSIENFDPAKASKECLCQVTNLGGQQNVVLNIIDIRLQTYYKEENETHANCSSALFQSPVLAAHCQDSNRHYHDNFYRSRQYTILMAESQTKPILLTNIHTNGMLDSPAMVWFSLTAEENSGFSLTCKEVIPAEFTSSTTTTTTSTPTTTTSTTTTSTTTTTPTTTSTTTTPTTTSSTSTTTSTTPSTTTTTTPTTTKTTTKPTTTTTTTSPTITTTYTTPTTTTTTTKPTTTTTPTPTTTKKASTSTTTSTTTTTTKQPTTTTTSTSTRTPLSSAPTTTTSSTSQLSTTPERTTRATPEPTVAPTSLHPETTTRDTSVTEEVLVPKQGDGEDDHQQRIKVYLAICIPVIVGLLVITFFILWMYWKRTSPRQKKFNFMKGARQSDVYNTFKNPYLLDDYIRDMSITNRSSVIEKRPISSFISVPSQRPKSILSNGSVQRREPAFPVQPYVIPINTTSNEPIFSKPNRGPSVVKININSDKADEEPVVIADIAEPGNEDLDLSNLTDVYDPESNKDTAQDRQDDVDRDNNDLFNKTKDDGAVLIHVDNLSLPPISSRSSKPFMSRDASFNTSTRSLEGSTPGSISTDDRDTDSEINSSDRVINK